jgi:hypothetical protein
MRCGASCSPACAPSRAPAPRSPDASTRASPSPRSCESSSATSPARPTGISGPPSHHRSDGPGPITARRHPAVLRSICRPAAPTTTGTAWPNKSPPSMSGPSLVCQHRRSTLTTHTSIARRYSVLCWLPGRRCALGSGITYGSQDQPSPLVVEARRRNVARGLMSCSPEPAGL